MVLEDFKELVSMSATVSSSIHLLTGISICSNFFKKGTTGEATSAPFVSLLSKEKLLQEIDIGRSIQNKTIRNEAKNTPKIIFPFTDYGRAKLFLLARIWPTYQ